MPLRHIACPIVIQKGRLLVFRHPSAGIQLVKGGIRPGEPATRAACRELHEEAGITSRATAPATRAFRISLSSLWHFVPVAIRQTPAIWRHFCTDDGGHMFTFFWHPLHRPLHDAHPLFERARQHIVARS